MSAAFRSLQNVGSIKRDSRSAAAKNDVFDTMCFKHMGQVRAGDLEHDDYAARGGESRRRQRRSDQGLRAQVPRPFHLPTAEDVCENPNRPVCWY